MPLETDQPEIVVTAVAIAVGEPGRRRPSLVPRVRGRRLWPRTPFVSLFVLVMFVLAGTVGPLLAPHDPDRVDLSRSLQPPVFDGGSWSSALGTDELGRDVFSRLLSGARVSLLVALTVVVIAGLLGLTVALIAGYRGGRLDAAVMRFADASMAFPFVLLAIIIVATYGASLTAVIVVLILAGWPQYARVLRAEVLRIRNQDYVVMCQVMGGSTWRILSRHILPNIVGTLLVLATLQVGLAIIAEGSLSFLGIGVPPPAASWGNMLAEGRSYLATAWWVPVLPGICLSVTVLATNLVGDWLRGQLDPVTRR